MPFKSRCLKTALTLALGSPFALASTVQIQASGGNAALNPSSDTLTLNAANTTVTAPGDFVIQSGNLYIGYYPPPNQTIYFSVTQTITINGITNTFNIFGQDVVAGSADTVTIFAGQPVSFGAYFLTVDSATWSAVPGSNVPLSISAMIVPVPEPGSLTLISSGFFAGALTLRRRSLARFSAV